MARSPLILRTAKPSTTACSTSKSRVHVADVIDIVLTCSYSYSIHIGEIHNQFRCNDFLNLLQSSEVGLQHYSCDDDGFGQTYAYFRDTSKSIKSTAHRQIPEMKDTDVNFAVNRAGSINNAAHAVWPAVNGFNCPDT